MIPSITVPAGKLLLKLTEDECADKLKGVEPMSEADKLMLSALAVNWISRIQENGFFNRFMNDVSNWRGATVTNDTLYHLNDTNCKLGYMMLQEFANKLYPDHSFELVITTSPEFENHAIVLKDCSDTPSVYEYKGVDVDLVKIGFVEEIYIVFKGIKSPKPESEDVTKLKAIIAEFGEDTLVTYNV